jgi:hypothetical protein
MCEVAYMMGLGGLTDPATLYRAVLAPIGCTVNPKNSAVLTASDYGMTFFNGDSGASDPLGTSDLVNKKAQPIAQGVIHFEVRLWSQYTWLPATSATGWDPSLTGYSASNEAVTPFAVWTNSCSPVNSGSLYTWNSDRVTVAGTPQFPMTWGQTGFAPPVTPPAPDYANDPSVACDNVFPRAVMVVVTIEPPNELSVPNPLRTLDPITDASSTAAIRVIGQAPPFNPEWPFVKIDNEWIRIKSLTAGTIVVDTNGRGVRGTAGATHSAGTRVLIGYTFSRVFNNPATREYWGQ